MSKNSVLEDLRVRRLAVLWFIRLRLCWLDTLLLHKQQCQRIEDTD